jgi:hypothetical protein
MGSGSAVNLTRGLVYIEYMAGTLFDSGYALGRPEFEELLRNVNTLTKETPAAVLEQGGACYSVHYTPETKKEIRRFYFEALKERPALAKHIHATYHDPAL